MASLHSFCMFIVLESCEMHHTTVVIVLFFGLRIDPSSAGLHGLMQAGPCRAFFGASVFENGVAAYTMHKGANSCLASCSVPAKAISIATFLPTGLRCTINVPTVRRARW